MKDEKMLDDIRRMTQDVEIPTELEPENMMKSLEGVKQVKKSRYMKPVIAVASVLATAAVVGVVLGARLATKGLFGYKLEQGELVADIGSVKLNETKNGFIKLDSYDSIIKYMEKKEKLEEFKNYVEDTFINFGMGAKKEDAVFDGALEMGPQMNMGVTGTGTNKAPGSVPEVDNVGGTPDFSDTELRTEGVMEGDIVKTDGKYIYVGRGNGDIDVYLAAGKDTKKLKNISNSKEMYHINEMYLYKGKLIVIGQKANEGTITCVYVMGNDNAVTCEAVLNMDGYFETARLVDGYLYTFTKKSLNNYEEDGVVPYVNGKEVSVKDVYVVDDCDYSSYLIVTALDLSDTSKYVGKMATIVNQQTEFYVSQKHIYVYGTKYSRSGRSTAIMKFAYEKGKVEAMVKTSFEGSVDDTFCIDEYNGYLRVVVTTWNSGNVSNALYVFDKDLKEVGKLKDMAVGETVYSAMFMGDVAYFVTYLQTDPLFSVDLSNPNEPKLIGALKIPGFSDYMRPFGEGRLLGFGYDDMRGNKMSLFDISDPADVKELDVTCGDGFMYGMSVLDNYKAVLVSPEKNIIGFSAFHEGYDGERAAIKYFIFSVKNNEFVLEKSIKVGEASFSKSIGDIRGMYIGDYMYIVVPERGVLVYSVGNYEYLAIAE